MRNAVSWSLVCCSRYMATGVLLTAKFEVQSGSLVTSVRRSKLRLSRPWSCSVLCLTSSKHRHLPTHWTELLQTTLSPTDCEEDETTRHDQSGRHPRCATSSWGQATATGRRSDCQAAQQRGWYWKGKKDSKKRWPPGLEMRPTLNWMLKSNAPQPARSKTLPSTSKSAM